MPLSFAQRRLWFLDQLEGPARPTTFPLALRLSGPLDAAALEAALGDVVDRHESLRTFFPDTLGVPRQQILEASAARPRLVIEPVDGGDACRGRLRRRRSGGSTWPSEPPLRAHAVCAWRGEHVLLLLLHHIAGDGWSMAPLWRDVAAPMRRGCGRAPDCRRCRCSMRITRCGSMRCWGGRTTRTARSRGSLRSGRERLAGLPEQIELPTDRPRPAVASYRGARCRLQIGTADCTRACWRLPATRRRSLFMVLQAGVGGAADAGWGRAVDIPIGSPIAGRTDERARRSGRLLRQHAGAAHRHVRRSELPRTDCAGAGQQSGGLRPSGPAVRAAGGGAQPGAVAGASSAVPGDAGAAEQCTGQPRPAGT